jgi:hypothetical protein
MNPIVRSIFSILLVAYVDFGTKNISFPTLALTGMKVILCVRNDDKIDHDGNPVKDRDGKTVKITIPGHKIIAALNDQNILLYPFTVDPIGQIGPMACTLLHGHETIPDPKAATMQPASQLAHARATATNSICGILPIANARWKQTKGDRWFAPSYQHMLPGQWATQVLHLNITTSLAAHILRCSQKGHHKFATQRRPYTPGQNSLSRDFTNTRTRTRSTLNTVPQTRRLVHATTTQPSTYVATVAT